MALILEITRADGSVVRQPVDQATARYAAQAGDKIRLLDAQTGQPAGDLAAHRVGDALLVDQGGQQIELSGFFTECAPGEACELIIGDGDKATTISQTTEPMGTTADGSALVYDASIAAQNATSAGAAAQGGATAGAGTGAGAGAAAGVQAAAGITTSAVLAGVAGVGVAAAAAGGGGGGSGTPADTTAPDAPVIATIAGDNVIDTSEAAAGVSISGTAEAGSTVTVTLANTAISKTATADSSGAWSVSLASSEVPADGSYSVSATAQDAAGNTSNAATASLTVAATPADTTAPAAPVINAITGDGSIDDTEAAAGFAITGTAEAGSTVAVTVVGTSISKTATAAGDGSWSVSIATGEVPSNATYTVSATATDAASNVSTAGTSSMVVSTTIPDTTAPAAPVITTVATDDIINAAEATAGVTVAGTAEANSSVAVTFGSTTKTVTADGTGNWTSSFTSGELPADGAVSISATATDSSSNTSAAGTRPVTLDTAAPAAPVITTVATDDIINAAEATAGVTVAGTAEANSSVAVTFGSTTKTVTADGTGNWTSSFASGELPADGAATISAVATDAAGNAGTAGTLPVTIDTAVAAPTLTINGDGSVSGTAEAGATISLDHDGDGGASTAALTTVASGGVYSFTTGTVSNTTNTSFNASATATDAAGNISTATTAAVAAATATTGADTISNASGAAATIFGLAGNDTLTASTTGDRLDGGAGDDTLAGGTGNDIIIGGSGADALTGGDGADILIGGSAASVRNYQFDYWNITNPTDVDSSSPSSTASDASFAGFKGTADLGWTVAGTGTKLNGSTTVTTGGIVEYHGNAASLGGEDGTGTGGTHFWETVFTGSDGASGLTQTLSTSAGESYTLTIQASNFDNDASLAVVWNGVEIAYYDGTTNADIVDPANWTGSATMTPATGPQGDRALLNFTVDGNATGETSTLTLQAYDVSPGPNGDGLLIDRVTLNAVTGDGNDTLAGGVGADLLFGQAGDDTLTGGASGATVGSTDADQDTFVYSMASDNGADTITDFTVGTDRIMLVDSIDASRGSSLGVADTLTSDTNLTAADFLVSGTQNITLSDNAGSLQLTFTGEGGAALGSVTLTGTSFSAGPDASDGSYSSVAELFGAGETQILFATGDGFNNGLI